MCFALAFALAFFQLHDDDAGFHVATGRLVREAWTVGAPVPTANPFSYADPGAPWVQHQHLPAAAIAWLVDDAPRRLGLPSTPAHPNAAVLVTVKAALVGLLFALLAATARARGLSAALTLLLVAAAAAAASPRFYERPLLASALLLAAAGLGLGRFRDGAGRGWLGLAAAATLANGHLHAGVVDAMLLWAAVVAGAAVEAAWRRRHPASDLSPARTGQLMLAFGATVALLAGSLAWLAPSGLDVLLLPLRFSTDAWWNTHLLEFRPLWQAFDKLPWVTGYLAATGVVVVLGACSALSKEGAGDAGGEHAASAQPVENTTDRLPGCLPGGGPPDPQTEPDGAMRNGLLAVRRLRPADLLLVVGFGALALKHQRMLLTFVVATLPAVAAALADLHRRTTRHTSPTFRRIVPRLAVALAAAIGFGAWVEQSARFQMGLGPAEHRGIDPRAHPFRLLDRLDTDRLPGEVFVSDGFAGTFLWRYFPQRQVLVHNVIEAYRPGVYRDAYMALRYAEPGFEERLRALGVRSFLLKHASAGERALQQGRPNLRDVLFSRSGSGAYPDAVLVDFDDAGALWVLRDALPSGVRSFDGLGVNPDTGALDPTASPQERLNVLRAHAMAHPGCRRCRFLLEKALALLTLGAG